MLIWKEYAVDKWISNSEKKITYRIEIERWGFGIEYVSSITFNSFRRSLGWSPSLKVAQDRCQYMEDYYDTHLIVLDE